MKNVLELLDTTHNRLLERVSPLSEEVFTRRPAENEWSVAEIVHHLCLVEERVIKDLERALQEQPRRPSLLRRMVPTSIVASRAIKVKSPKAVQPTNPPEKRLAVESYNDARNRLKNLYTTHGHQRLSQTIFKHPFLGEISGTSTVSFIAHHEQRHYKQICEVLGKLEQ